MSKVVFVVIAVALVALVAAVIALSVKQSIHKNFVNHIKANFSLLQQNAKAINDSYLSESVEYLELVAVDVKDNDKIKTDLIGILDKYKESGKLSSDDFYDRAYNTIIEK